MQKFDGIKTDSNCTSDAKGATITPSHSELVNQWARSGPFQRLPSEKLFNPRTRRVAS